jgi:hypothetical protein
MVSRPFERHANNVSLSLTRRRRAIRDIVVVNTHMNGVRDIRVCSCMTIDGYLNGSGQLRLSVPFNAGMAALDISSRGLDAYRVRYAWRANDHVRAVDSVSLHEMLPRRFRITTSLEVRHDSPIHCNLLRSAHG